jgi:NAD+-dependent farnesol dehydrogenase
MKVLVTGGTGYLGSAIVRALAARGHEPVAFARRASSAGLPGAVIDGDVRDRGGVEDAVRRVDAVCHTAALVSLWRPNPREFDDVNVSGLENVLGACEARGIPRIAYTSSFLALPPAGAAHAITANDYQRTKVRARQVVLDAVRRGLPIVSLYPGVIYGPGTETEGNLIGRLVREHLEGKLAGIVGASRIWSYAYVDDVAAAHVRALEAGAAGEEFVLGGENARQLRVFEIVRALTGRPLPRQIPYPVAAAAGMVEEARARLTGRPPLITRGAVEIFRYDWTLASGNSESRLGYRSIGLEDGLRHVIGNR